jgi:DNA replication protein DnaC
MGQEFVVSTTVVWDILSESQISPGYRVGYPVATTAIVDRMIHHAIIINIEGPSWRMHESEQLNQKSLPDK